MNNENTYNVSLVNSQGCNFENANFTDLEKAKKWSAGHGKKYTAYFKKNYDAEINASEEEFEIQY